MPRSSRFHRKTLLLHSLLLLLIFLLLATWPTEGRGLKRQKTVMSERNNARTMSRRTSTSLQTIKNNEDDIPELKKSKKKMRKRSSKRARSYKSKKELIQGIILTHPEFYKFLSPDSWQKNLKELLVTTDYQHFRGTVRRKRLYCRVGIGYHLEITDKGKVRARHLPTSNGILEIFSVKRGVVGIRSAKHKSKYLCMSKSGRIFTKKRFQPNCEFRENLEGNRFNTYASQQYSNHKARKGYFLAVNRNGRFPRHLKKITWRQKRTHWLPRTV